MAAQRIIALGQLVGVHGTRGELRLRPFNPDSTTLSRSTMVVLRHGHHQQQRQVLALRPHKQGLLLTLAGCESRTAAQALVGHEVCIPEKDLPPTGPNEVYHYQLLGMTVVTTAGTELGSVAGVLVTGSNDVCVVRAHGHEQLIPLIADVVKQVDREQRRLVIDPLPGLLEH
ncbi:MAG: ribosome maturation factor RimM [Candidatus Binatia bacterium]